MRNNNDNKIIGLQTLPQDERDFSHSQSFGAISVSELPTKDFIVSVPFELKNQDINYPSDYCAAYSAAAVAESEDLIVFCPEWTFAYAKYLLSQKKGTYVLDEFGLNLRDVCNAAVKGGFLPKKDDPYRCNSASRPMRSFIVDIKNWPISSFTQAQPYVKLAYYAVDGPYDIFDNMRSTMWKNIEERRAIITGCYFRLSWNQSANGIIPKIYENSGSPHAFVFIGQKTINDEVHLVARLSNGYNVGDNGLFYFPREVVNKEFTQFGAYTFKDKLPTAITDSNGVSLEKINKWNPLWIFQVISNYFKK